MDSNVQYWFGDLWPLVRDGKWGAVQERLDMSQYARRVQKKYLTLDDDTTEKVAAKYGDYGPYRFRHAAAVICEIRGILGDTADRHKTTLYPITMVDSIGRSDFCLIAYNRQTYNREIVLWPLDYHVEEARKGFHDDTPFRSKRYGVVFRGSCSSPLYANPIDVVPPIVKTSRYEIVMKNHHHPWADLGLTKTELYHAHPDYPRVQENLNRLDKGIMTRERQMQYQFVLCIEGADVSTSFGWVLASHCVAIHPYPFLFEVWYFRDLRPWVHFIPIALDGSDLPDIMEWCRNHPDACEHIAHESAEYMRAMCDADTLARTKSSVVSMWDLGSR